MSEPLISWKAEAPAEPRAAGESGSAGASPSQQPVKAREEWQVTATALAISNQRVFLWLSVVVLVLSALLTVPASRAVAIPGVNFELPGLCTFRRLAGIDCPGCGLTRSFICVAHGDLSRAWDFNPIGPLFFPLIAIQVPYRLWQLARIRRGEPAVELGTWGLVPLLIVAGLLIVQWLVKLSQFF